MKVTYHIPTESYGFVEAEFEVDGESPPSYESVKKDILDKTEGLNELQFNSVLDRYIEAEGVNAMTAEEYESLNDSQKTMIQTLKRAFKRKRAKLEE